MTDEQQQENERRQRDEYDTLTAGLTTPFWQIVDRELAKRERLAFDALAAAANGDLAMRAAGELVAVRSLREMPKTLIESYRNILIRARQS